MVTHWLYLFTPFEAQFLVILGFVVTRTEITFKYRGDDTLLSKIASTHPLYSILIYCIYSSILRIFILDLCHQSIYEIYHQIIKIFITITCKYFLFTLGVQKIFLSVYVLNLFISFTNNFMLQCCFNILPFRILFDNTRVLLRYIHVKIRVISRNMCSI